MNKVGNRSLWNRVAVIGTSAWLGGTYLLTLIRGESDFQFWNANSNDYDPSAAFWFALTGMILVVIFCRSISGIIIAARPRPFWKKIGTLGACMWIGVTILYISLYPDSGFGFGINRFDSDNGLWFALIGATILYGVFSSIPWVTDPARSDGA
jgi:hypothetical protein